MLLREIDETHFNRLKKRLHSSVTIDKNNCWNWKLFIDKDGYGQTSLCIDGKKHTLRAARASYNVFMGEVDDKMVIDHLCRNRRCINPKHLETVTVKINTLRGEAPSAKNAIKTQCLRGHEFTPTNTYHYINSRSGIKSRGCKTCNNERQNVKRRIKHYANSRG